jgi:DNA-binding NtrC family response regulator
MARKTSVLVADDDGSVRESLKSIIEAAGYEAFEAEDGDEALSVLSKRPIDLLLLDLSMPKCDGLGVLARITPPPVVIVLSAFAYFTMEDVSERAKGKVFRCLSKPISPQKLLDAITEAISSN